MPVLRRGDETGRPVVHPVLRRPAAGPGGRGAGGGPQPEPAPVPVVPSPRSGEPAPTARWPCTSCGATTPLDRAVCHACGEAFLSELHRDEPPLLVLPVVGDLTRLTRTQRVVFGVGASAVAVVATGALGLLLR